jgi:hypothetical protein
MPDTERTIAPFRAFAGGLIVVLANMSNRW